MDKYEYKVRADEIKALIQEKKFREAVEIADTIDWKNVRNSMMLCTISDLYKICKRYEDSRDVLLLAYQRNPSGRLILYSLCELSIKLNDVAYAVEYFKEYAQVAPKDPGLFILKYKLYTAQGVGTEERIQVLEDLQKLECKEKWMYELAYLYHTIGYGAQCVEECNQIILFFGEGKYVIKALELKQIHEPLSGEQDILYRRLVSPAEDLVKGMDIGKFNTIDLQKELAESLKDVLFDDTKTKTSNEGMEVVSEAATSIEKEVIEEAPVEEIVEESLTEVLPVIEEAPVKEEPFIIRENIEEAATQVLPKITPEKEESLNETKIFNAKDVETALNNKESHASIENYEEHKKSAFVIEPLPDENTGRVVFPHYDEMVSLEGDGQISFVVPEEEMVDKQITGQISIEDVLAEWERMKNDSEKKWREDVRKRVLAQTDGIFKSFDETARGGLLERLEVSVNASERIELTKEETLNLVKENEEHGGLAIDIEDVPSDDTVVAVPYVAPPIETVPEVKIEVPMVEPWKPEPVKDMHEITFEDSNDESLMEQENLPDEGPTPEELSFDRTPFIGEEEEKEEDKEEVSEETVTEVSEDDYLFKFAEASEERDQALSKQEEVSLDEATEENTNEVNSEEQTEEVTLENAKEETEEVTASEETIAEEVSEEIASGEISVEEVSEEETVTEEIAVEEVTEKVSKEETASNEIEIPEEEIVTEESVSEEKALEEVPVIDETNDEITGKDSLLTPEQRDRFESFIFTESGVDQLIDAFSKMSMESGTGNMIIGSEDVDSAIELGKSIITELSERESITGKVAKIKASTLNAKDAYDTLNKLYDGALIIQDAHELRLETLTAIKKTLAAKEKRMFVVLTISNRHKHKFIMDNSDMLESFTISYDIESLDNATLVKYAKEYAYQREFGIDEMGMLALHTRIEEKQTNAHSVTVTEVKDIVDAAIMHACKRNVGHFFETVVGKRYDANDMIVLREKDFQIK